ncbi:MAG: hypothetical protein ACRDZ3_16965 [Acidimicrobiia bacterium]
MADTMAPGALGAPDGGVAAPPPAAGSAAPRRRLFTWAGLVVGTAVAMILVAPAFGSRPPAGEDVMSHLVRADFGIPELVARGRMDGWFPRFVLGHQEFLFNGPGLVWLMALLRGATFGLLSNAGALKVVSMASYVAMVPAVWFLARSFGLSHRAAGLGAVLSTWVSNPFGVGLEGLFKVGLIPHQLGAVLFCLALGACLRLVDDARPRWTVLAAVSLAGLALTHLISVLVLAVVLALALATLAARRALPWAGLRRVTTAGLVSGGLAGFWLLPLLAHRDLRGIVTTWGTPPIGERLARIARGDLLLPTGVGALALVAAVYLLTRRRPLTTALAVAPFAYLAVAHGSLAVLGGNEVTLQLANRGLGYAGLLAVLGVGALLAAITTRLGTPGHLAALVAVAGVALTLAPGRNAAGQLAEPVPQMRAAAFALEQVVPDGARFATQRDFPGEVHRTGVIHPETWLARISGRNSLNGFNLESSSTPSAAFAPDKLDESGPRASARRLSRFGTTHVVTTSTKLFGDLTGSGRFLPVWQDPPLAILEVVPPDGQPDPASLLSSNRRPFVGRLTDTRSEHVGIEIEAPAPSVATVAIAWSPKWHGTINDTPVELRRTIDGLITLDIPTGTSDLALTYRPDPYDRLGPAITLATLLAGALSLRHHRKNQLRDEGVRRPNPRSEEPPADEPRAEERHSEEPRAEERRSEEPDAARSEEGGGSPADDW